MKVADAVVPERRTFNRAASQNMLHLVSAWSTANDFTLGQVAVDEKSNESTTIPQLLAAVDITGATVTIDAMGCQKDIAKAITSGGGDYVLAVKGNQETTLRLLQETLAEHWELEAPPPRGTRHETHEVKHGREEPREYVSLPAPASLKKLGWSSVRSIGMVHCRTIRDGKSRVTTSALTIPTPASWRSSHAAIGASRTVCIGSWTGVSMKTSVACGRAMRPRTSRCSTGLAL